MSLPGLSGGRGNWPETWPEGFPEPSFEGSFLRVSWTFPHLAGVNSLEPSLFAVGYQDISNNNKNVWCNLSLWLGVVIGRLLFGHFIGW